MEILSTATQAMKAGLDWHKDGEAVNRLGVAIVGSVALVIACVAIVFLVVGAAVMGIMGGATGALSSGAVFAMLGGIMLLIPVALALYLAIAFLFFRVWAHMLGAFRKKQVGSSVSDFLKFLGINIATQFAAVFSWYDKRFLAIPAAAVVMLILSPFAPVAALIAFLLVLAYMAVVVRNSSRLVLAQFRFMEQGYRGAGDALAWSWGATAGKALSLFAILAIIFVCFEAALLLSAVMPIAGSLLYLAALVMLPPAMMLSTVYVYDFVDRGMDAPAQPAFGKPK